MNSLKLLIRGQGEKIRESEEKTLNGKADESKNGQSGGGRATCVKTQQFAHCLYDQDDYYSRDLTFCGSVFPV